MTVKGDLSTRQGAADLIGATVERHGRVDVLVNNAGGGVIRETLAHTEETLRETIDRNLWTTIYCTLEVLPLMIEQRYGRIVNIGAESVRNGLFQHAIYNAAKGGVHGLTTGLAREFIGYGITVNTVAPSMIATEQVAQVMADPQLAPLLGTITDTIPAGRPGEMSEVASMVAYLASDEATFVTGQVISVNGGSSML
jgi:2,3-dihydroxy-2,3-dihydro-p-cumate dehydrogenase